MTVFRTFPMQNSAILRLNAEKERINVAPDYQRKGEVWTLEKRQLLIDSILNDYDIPKLYFHLLSNIQRKEQGNFDYSIIDGRQRIETIWSFANDEFPLSDEFIYLDDQSIKASGLTYSELGLSYPKLKIRFDSFTLPITCIETEDIELIEEMFSRLNEAVPLNATEKRNAIGGPMAEYIRELSNHSFFSKRVKFSDNRYQHREVVTKLLFIEFSILFQHKIIDTKKPYLDNMVKQYKEGEINKLNEIEKNTLKVIDQMDKKFEDNDNLLRTQSVVPIYYLVLRTAIKNGEIDNFSRDKIIEFHSCVDENKKIASKDIASANFEFLEFDRMSQQGTNDAASIRERARTLCNYLGINVPDEWPQN